MHQIKTSIREILPADLPTVTPIDEPTRAMTEQELLDAGISKIVDNYYSCIHQERRDPETLEWQPIDGQVLPGTVISEGVLRDRYARLPSESRPRIMRAQVLTDGRFRAAETLAEVGSVASDAVGLVDGEPLIDVESEDAIATEATRLAVVPDSGVERQFVAEAEIGEGDIVEASGLIPHAWAGEPRR